jgi:hypothetical protein
MIFRPGDDDYDPYYDGDDLGPEYDLPEDQLRALPRSTVLMLVLVAVLIVIFIGLCINLVGATA